MSKAYKDFKEYMEYNYYDSISKRLGSYIVAHKDSFENNEFHKITWIEQDEITYTVCGVTFKDLGNENIEIRTTVEAQVPFSGYTKYGADSDGDSKLYNVFFNAYLDNGLQNVKITDITEYNKAAYDKDKTMSQSWLNYMYEEKMDEYAEDFLKRNYPKALLQPMPVNPFEVADAMKMKIYYAPLGDSIFGKTYFGEELVTVYDNPNNRNEIEIKTTPGTMLINPDVYFMRNIGTANNTIIHECVHWDRHRRAFELQKLLNGGASHISCEVVEGKYEGIGPEESALKWMEWQANQLAPKILMPAAMTKRKLADLMQAEYQSNPFERFSVHMENALEKLSAYFGVSFLAAKLRALELGFDQAEGSRVFCNGRYLPPFSFRKGTLNKDQTFIIDENNLLFNLIIKPELGTLFAEGKIVYANSMLCVCKPEYVTFSETGEIILTDYALEHVDECCYIFHRKYSVSNEYADTYYRRCFLCRDVDTENFVEADYDTDNKSNQTKTERVAEYRKINTLASEMEDVFESLPMTFSKTLKAHLDRLDLSEEDLHFRCYISTNTISKYVTDNSANKKIENVVAVIKALGVNSFYMDDLFNKSGFGLNTSNRDVLFVKYLIWNHPLESVDEWRDRLKEAKSSIKLPENNLEK